MEIQSLSVCVPAGCPNNCKFCVSKMKGDEYPNHIEKKQAFRGLYKDDYKRRMEFARDNGCNTVILTGQGEPLMNKRFLEDFFEWNENMRKPFRWIELQTSGVTLVHPDEPDQKTLRWLRNAGVSTVAVSISAWDDDTNASYNGTPENMKVNVENLCREVRRYDFNLRLSMNMTCAFEDVSPDEIFRGAQRLGANQVTFRKLYESGIGGVQDTWIRKHKLSDDAWEKITSFVTTKGRKLERMPFGAYKYSLGGISTVMDTDCMSTAKDKEALRYLVLRPDCRLYSKWDDKGSLIF